MHWIVRSPTSFWRMGHSSMRVRRIASSLYSMRRAKGPSRSPAGLPSSKWDEPQAVKRQNAENVL